MQATTLKPAPRFSSRQKFDSVILAPEERRDRLRHARSSIVLHSGFEATVGDLLSRSQALAPGNYWSP
jgi:hypothetical protein